MSFNLPEHAVWVILLVVTLAIGIFIYYFIFQESGIQNLLKILGFLNIFG